MIASAGRQGDRAAGNSSPPLRPASTVPLPIQPNTVVTPSHPPPLPPSVAKVERARWPESVRPREKSVRRQLVEMTGEGARLECRTRCLCAAKLGRNRNERSSRSGGPAPRRRRRRPYTSLGGRGGRRRPSQSTMPRTTDGRGAKLPPPAGIVDNLSMLRPNKDRPPDPPPTDRPHRRRSQPHSGVRVQPGSE